MREIYIDVVQGVGELALVFLIDVGGVGYLRLTSEDLQPDIPSLFSESGSHTQWSILLQAGTLSLFLNLAWCVQPPR